MAHIVASITVFVNHAPAIISAAAKVRALQTQGLPRCLVPLPANGGQQVMFFWHLHVLPPIQDLLYLIRNKVDY